MKKTLSTLLSVTTLFASFAFAFVVPVQAQSPTATWDTTGDYVVEIEYLGDFYNHDITLDQDALDQLSGNGGTPAGANTYDWTITDGMVTGDDVSFSADYTATADAVTPQTTMEVDGTVANDGTMSGTWSDNYQGESRSGTWSTISGTADYLVVDDNPETVSVTIEKFVQGSMATAITANDADFPMTATYNADNTGAGTGSYTLSETNNVPYQAMTTEMTPGADYETSEVLTGDMVGAECTTDVPFALEGYTTGDTRAEAMAATPTMTIPTFTNLQDDKHVIVWNIDCSIEEGEINGDVVGEAGELEVTSIEMTDTTATANGSFADGWEYVFHVTVPTDEPQVAMKFADWMQTNGTGVIMVDNNMRISSLQADNGGATILLTADNVYSTPDLHMTTDLDPTMDGIQVEITVEVAVPVNTPNGAYTTAYGVQSNQ